MLLEQTFFAEVTGKTYKGKTMGAIEMNPDKTAIAPEVELSNTPNVSEDQLPPLDEMPNLVRVYGRFTQESTNAYDKAWIACRERQLLAALRELQQLRQENERLKAQVEELRQEIRDTARDAAAEANWKNVQGEDYGSY